MFVVPGERNRMGAGGRWKEHFASRDGPRKRTTLGSLMGAGVGVGMGVRYEFLFLLHGHQLEKKGE